MDRQKCYYIYKGDGEKCLTPKINDGLFMTRDRFTVGLGPLPVPLVDRNYKKQTLALCMYKSIHNKTSS